MTLPADTTPDARSGINALSPFAFGAFRILFGLLFLVHGTAKLFGFPQGDPVDFFVWPYWWAGIIEIVVGVLIAVGLFTRTAAFVGAGTMAVAYFWYFIPGRFLAERQRWRTVGDLLLHHADVDLHRTRRTRRAPPLMINGSVTGPRKCQAPNS